MLALEQVYLLLLLNLTQEPLVGDRRVFFVESFFLVFLLRPLNSLLHFLKLQLQLGDKVIFLSLSFFVAGELLQFLFHNLYLALQFIRLFMLRYQLLL